MGNRILAFALVGTFVLSPDFGYDLILTSWSSIAYIFYLSWRETCLTKVSWGCSIPQGSKQSD